MATSRSMVDSQAQLALPGSDNLQCNSNQHSRQPGQVVFAHVGRSARLRTPADGVVRCGNAPLHREIGYGKTLK
jgi:hypothetical protein